MQTMKNLTKYLFVTCAYATLCAPVAMAEDATSGIETIVVTAEKRAERFQDLPLAANVVASDQLSQQRITDISGLSAAVPSFTAHPGNGGFLTIRGLGTQSWAPNAEGDVAMYLDGVALGGGANAQDPATLFDVQQVEVLQGPQSTLFGKSAAAGAINVVTNAPEIGEFQVKGELTGDNRDGAEAMLVTNVPISDDSALRISGHEVLDSHNQYNTFTHDWNFSHSTGGRARFLYEPTSKLTVNIIADYNKVGGHGYNWSIINAPASPTPIIPPSVSLDGSLAACGVTPSKDNHKFCLSAPSFVDYEDYGASAQVDYRFDGGTTLTSITAQRVGKTKNQYDTSNQPYNNVLDFNDATVHQSSFSEELRVTSPSDQAFEYVAGLFYANNPVDGHGDQAGALNNGTLTFLGLTEGNSDKLKSRSETYAVFGQATYHLSDHWSLIGGIRGSHDSVSAHTIKSVAPGSIAPFAPDLTPINASGHGNDLSGKIGLQYEVDQSWMVYATASKGYKGPAINSGAPDVGVPLVVKPEQVYNYEIGTKKSFFGGAVQLAATAYYEKARDYQVTIFDPNTAQSYFSNARGLSIHGIDASIFGYLSERLFLAGGVTYNNATYNSGTYFGCGPTQLVGDHGCQLIAGNLVQNIGGQQAIGSPKLKFVGRVHYDQPLGDLKGFVESDVVYTDAVPYSAVYDPGNSASANWDWGARMGVTSGDGHWTASLWGRNLLDKRIPVIVFDTPVYYLFNSSGSHAHYLGPDSFRRIGVTIDFNY
jgi:iron complex outermembrane receptor protein